MRTHVAILLALLPFLAGLSSGCGQSITARGARSTLQPRVPGATPTAPRSSGLAGLAVEAATLPQPRRQVVEVALAMAGAPARDFDCSGLARHVFATTGLQLPRTVRQQLDSGRPVGSNDLRPGDLVFFSFKKGPADHVGIYIGDGSFVHVSSAARSVRLDSLAKSVFARAHVASRRFLD